MYKAVQILIIIVLSIIMFLTLYRLSNSQEDTLRHSELNDMPDALNTDHDNRYLLKTLQEEAKPSTPVANTARLYLDSTTNDFMIIFDDGDTVIIGDF